MKIQISIAVVAVLLAGCAPKPAETAAATPTATATAEASPSVTPVQAKDIVDTAVAAGQFKTLVAAVQAAGLESTLRGAGPFTVFAPTDAAFAALPAGTVDNLLKPENKAQLVAVLTYHVVPGKILAADVAGKTVEAVTVQGKAAKVVGAADGSVTINDAKVVSANIEASNGVIHVIDKVIMPPK